MLRSLYIAGTGMITQRSKMNVIVNNITNADTVGYRKDQVVTESFSDMLLDRLNDPAILNRRYVGPLAPGVYVEEIQTEFQAGPMELTDIQTDLAITGDGFFVVNTPQGERYTRAGNFNVDHEGALVTQEGYYVLGQNGQRIIVGTDDFAVNADGAIFANGQQVGALRIVQFADNGVLRKEGNNLLYAYNGEQPTPAAGYSIEQGMLEGSNVEVGREVADMLLTNRVYESSQKILGMVDESLARTMEMGRF